MNFSCYEKIGTTIYNSFALSKVDFQINHGCYENDGYYYKGLKLL